MPAGVALTRQRPRTRLPTQTAESAPGVACPVFLPFGTTSARIVSVTRGSGSPASVPLAARTGRKPLRHKAHGSCSSLSRKSGRRSRRTSTRGGFSSVRLLQSRCGGICGRSRRGARRGSCGVMPMAGRQIALSSSGKKSPFGSPAFTTTGHRNSCGFLGSGGPADRDVTLCAPARIGRAGQVSKRSHGEAPARGTGRGSPRWVSCLGACDDFVHPHDSVRHTRLYVRYEAHQ